MRGISDTSIHDLLYEIVALQEGWPLVRVVTYRGTTVLTRGCVPNAQLRISPNSLRSFPQVFQ